MRHPFSYGDESVKDNFDLALKRVLVHEGGKVNHPRDPGGKTNQGVTQKTYNGYRTTRKLKPRDVFLMTDDERDDIYDRQYWDAVKGDRLPLGVDYVVFDGAVNSGSSQSIKWLQRALGVSADGVIGQITLAAIENHPNHDRLIADICARRMMFLRSLRTWSVFGKGWKSRVDQVQRHGQAQATGTQIRAALFVPLGNGKGFLNDAKELPKTVVSDAGAGGGAGVAAGITWVQSQLEPYAATLPYLDRVVALIAVVGVLVTVGGTAYSIWARRRKAALKDALDIGEPAT